LYQLIYIYERKTKKVIHTSENIIPVVQIFVEELRHLNYGTSGKSRPFRKASMCEKRVDEFRHSRLKPILKQQQKHASVSTPIHMEAEAVYTNG
jgi:hypothetical protein